MGFSSKPSIKRTRPSNVFGHIPGVPIGSTFENRLFLHHSSVHSGILAGIAGSKDEGCYSVVLSGGYEDDKDEGYKFIYTGCGGRDTKNGEKPREGPQTCDQSWENSRNMSLRVSARTKKPVRVVRGYKSSSDFAPAAGYRYDGLYVVERAWMDVGKSGFKVCKFSLTRLPGQPPIPRREGTLHLDLSQWERPKHFGRDDTLTRSSRSASSASPEPERRARRKGKIPMAMPGVPLIRRPRDSGPEDYDGDEEDEDDAPSHPRSPLPAPPGDPDERRAGPPSRPPTVKPAPPSPIPLTTNVASANRRPAPAAAPPASTQAPQPDVRALLAEWSSGGISRGTPSASTPDPLQKLTPNSHRPLLGRMTTSEQPGTAGQHPVAPSSGLYDSRQGLSASRPRPEDDAEREAKRMRPGDTSM
ncbi:PUA-like domain-containing protein [Trametes punicea]|nr:PUA-like domain-containing protein [Trametes punicea]